MKWWRRFWRRRQMEEQLEKELRFHVEQHAADLMARGHTQAEARRQARLALAGPEQVKESCRDARGTRWLEDLLQDFRYALRTLRQKSGFAAVALLTLALGTGATTVMFTVVNSVLLRPLPYPEPGRLVALNERVEKTNGWPLAYLNFLDCRRDSRSLVSMSAWRQASGTISAPGEAEFVAGRQISSGLFSTLGIALLQGRAFLPEEDLPGGAPVIIIGQQLWQRRFGGRPDVIGSRLIFDSKAYTITGVAPAGSRLLSAADVFTPLGQNTTPPMQNREMHPGIRVIARLGPGITLLQAQADLAVISRHLAQQYPKSNAGREFTAQPLQQELTGDVKPTLWLLLGAVSFVLLIACVNVASLMLARAVSRERELAMRVALGAGRGRLVRQCLTESSVLALAGGLLGILLASVGTRPFLLFWPGSLPRVGEIQVDWRVLLFAVTLSLLSGLFFGLAPALRAPGKELEAALRSGSRAVKGSSRRLHSGLVITEIALAVVLLVAAGTFGRTLLRLAAMNPGLNVHNVLVSEVALSTDALANPTRLRAVWPEILDRIRRVPGVQSAAVADIVPMTEDSEEAGYWTGATAPPTNQMPFALLNLVTPEYTRVMGIPLRHGRFFNEHDLIGSEPVVVIDDVLAQSAFAERDPVGQRLSVQFLGPARIVGVVGHVRHWGPDADDQAKVRAQVYVPFSQLPDPFLRLTSAGMSLLVRTKTTPLNSVEAIRAATRGAARDQVLYAVRTMEQIMGGALARQRFLLLLFGIFAGLALLLACIGIYGVLAYLVGQRVPEIGVRVALGANANEVMWLVLKQSLGITFLGVAIGAAGALAAGHVLAGLVAGMQPATLSTFVLMILLLVVAALIASFLPARRASPHRSYRRSAPRIERNLRNEMVAAFLAAKADGRAA